MKQTMKRIFILVVLLLANLNVAESTKVERAPERSSFEKLPYAWRESLRDKPVETDFEALPRDNQLKIVQRIQQSMLSSRFKLPSEASEKYYQTEMARYVQHEKDSMSKNAHLNNLVKSNTEVAETVHHEAQYERYGMKGTTTITTTTTVTTTTTAMTTTTTATTTTTTTTTGTTISTTAAIHATSTTITQTTTIVSSTTTKTSKMLHTDKKSQLRVNGEMSNLRKHTTTTVDPPWKIQPKARAVDPPWKILKKLASSQGKEPTQDKAPVVKEQSKKSAPAAPILMPADTTPGNIEVRPAPAASQGGQETNEPKAWHHHLSDPEPPKIIGIAVTSMAFCAAIWAASRRPAMPQAIQFKPDAEPVF